MIKGSERRDNAKIIQFRAPSEHFTMVNIITTAINKKIKRVGSTDFYNVTDIMKLSIEALITGSNTLNILGKEFSISELIDEELAKFYSSNYKEEIYPQIILAIKEVLFDTLVEIEDAIQMKIVDTKNYQLDHDLSEINALIEIWRSDINNIDIEDGIREINSIIQQKELIPYASAELEKSIEDKLMGSEYFETFQGLKLRNNYQYSLILTYIREEISQLIAKLQRNTEKNINNKGLDDPFK